MTNLNLSSEFNSNISLPLLFPPPFCLLQPLFQTGSLGCMLQWHCLPRQSEVPGNIKFQELSNSTNNSLRGLSPNPRLSDLNEASVNEHPSSQVQLFHPRSLENLQEVHTYVSISLSVFLIYLPVYLSLFPSTHRSIDRSIYLSIYLPIRLSLHRSFSLSIYRSIYLSIDRSLSLSIYLSIDRSISLSIYLSICLTIYLLIFLFMYLSKYLSFFLPIVNTFPFVLFPSYPAFHRRRYPPPF